jgi:hypothetical protein
MAPTLCKRQYFLKAAYCAGIMSVNTIGINNIKKKPGELHNEHKGRRNMVISERSSSVW